MNKSDKNRFIETIAPIIQKYAKEYGYKVCSPIIAQACCESRYGDSGLSKKANNYFGIKCGKAWLNANKPAINMKTKEEYTVGKLVSINDWFRKYANMEEGVKGYFEFISTSRYANLKTATTPLQYLNLIKADGYATSSTYVNTNMNYIKMHNLDKYDTFNPEPVLRKGDKGMYVISWQTYLASLGYEIGKIDGVFGTITELCVKDYQKDKGLTPDGIIGKKTWATLPKGE